MLHLYEQRLLIHHRLAGFIHQSESSGLDRVDTAIITCLLLVTHHV